MSAYDQAALDWHKKYKGKIQVVSSVPLENKDDLSTRYTPWVAAPCKAIEADPSTAYDYTWKGRSVAVVSDWTAVLWLWNIWWLAWLPVMEGKAILMKAFADIDAVPIVLSTQDPDEIINVVEAISPTFGAINLEDIKAPQCFYIEEELNKRLSIPVFHDDQHGTAIVVLGALINALKIVWKEKSNVTTTIVWAWAAWIAIANILHADWFTNIRVVDSRGVISSEREWLNEYKQRLIPFNKDAISWSIDDAISWSDIVIWVSQPNIITQDHVRSMNNDAIVFALSNPDPEIIRDDALEAWAVIYASGRSDFPNQVNNVLIFPWLLRGALDARIEDITMDHKVTAAHVLASITKNPTPDEILPSALDKSVAEIIRQSIMNT